MILLVVVVLIGALLMAGWVGARIGARVAAGPNPNNEGAGVLLGGAMGLMGLLIGFTFAMSAERFETRRELVVAEANALSTTYLRDSLLPGAFGPRLDALVTQYGAARLDFFAAGRDARRLADIGRRTGELQDQIWKETASALRLPQSAPVTTSVLLTTNEMFDLAASRQAARLAPVPGAVFWLLALVSIGTASLCGFNLALAGNRHLAASSAVFVMIAASIALIVDLDWPATGLVLVPQQPMISQVADLRAHESRRGAFTLPDATAPPAGAANPN